MKVSACPAPTNWMSKYICFLGGGDSIRREVIGQRKLPFFPPKEEKQFPSGKSEQLLEFIKSC